MVVHQLYTINIEWDIYAIYKNVALIYKSCIQLIVSLNLYYINKLFNLS